MKEGKQKIQDRNKQEEEMVEVRDKMTDSVMYYSMVRKGSMQKVFWPCDWSINNFEIGRHLGQGKYGHVYLAREKKSKYVVALKVQYKKQLKRGHIQTAKKQLEIQSQIDHKNIAKMLGFFYDEKRLYTILEYLPGGQLYQKLMETQNGFEQKVAARYIKQFISALQYLHQKDILHRDIKPQNIILDSQGNLKLSDFGFATKIEAKRKTYCGTLIYLAPQVVRNDFGYDKRSQIWSLGILAYQLNCKKPPFFGDTLMIKRNILSNNYTIPSYFSAQLKDFINRLLKFIESQRMTLEQAMNHPWITMHN